MKTNFFKWHLLSHCIRCFCIYNHLLICEPCLSTLPWPLTSFYFEYQHMLQFCVPTSNIHNIFSLYFNSYKKKDCVGPNYILTHLKRSWIMQWKIYYYFYWLLKLSPLVSNLPMSPKLRFYILFSPTRTPMDPSRTQDIDSVDANRL